MVEPTPEDPGVSLEIHSGTPRSTFSAAEFRDYEEWKRQKPKVFVLIERFYHQIRYGCTASACQTSACRSCQERKSNGAPYRVPTTITACAIAASLASLDNPFAYLCNNIPAPKRDPFDLAFMVSREIHGLNGLDNQGFCVKSDNIRKASKDLSGLADWFAKAEIEEWMHGQAASGTPVNLNQHFPYKPDNDTIDTKSFTQMLIKSFSWNTAPILDNDDCNPLSRLPRPQPQVYGADLSQSPLEDIYNKLENIDGPIPFKSFLLDKLDFCDCIKQAYTKEGFRLRMDATWLSPATFKALFTVPPLRKPISGDPEIMRHYSRIFGDPSELMLYGLNPFPTFDGPASSDLSAESNSGSLGLSIHQSRLSQSHLVLWCEFYYLKNFAGMPLDLCLQWLPGSIKHTHFNRTTQNSMPSCIAAHILAISFATLSAFTFNTCWIPDGWEYFTKFRSQGHITEDSFNRPFTTRLSDLARSMVDHWTLAYEEPAAQHLAALILRSFASWTYASTKIASRSKLTIDRMHDIEETDSDFKNRLLLFLSAPVQASNQESSCQPPFSLGLLEWARTIFARHWDGNYQFKWDTDIGASIEFMRWLYLHRDRLGIDAHRFTIDYLVDRMDYVEACRDWMDFSMTSTTGHLLDYPWLFNNKVKILIFRAINLCRMFSAFVSSVSMVNMKDRMESSIKESAQQLLDRLSVSMDKILVLEIRRDNILRDAFNQLWRRQKRELFRPLRVRMGMDEGEEGVDMGGVQQEFFRLAIADALEPANGLFTVDERTRMTWFQPLSAAPLYQFTLIGLLFGLAVYNGITLTITFPLAFYRKLLEMKNAELTDINDGWPDLYAGLQNLLTWSEGDVEDVFFRAYTFSFESHGVVHDVDMEKVGRDQQWPTDSHAVTATLPNTIAHTEDTVPSLEDSTEPSMVTNQNRNQYVNDYIFWLTEKSIIPQFQAFATGFYLPLQKKSLGMFTPEELQLLLEGHDAVPFQGLWDVTRYEDGYSSSHPKIQEFWEIIRDFTPSQLKKLLEFVTASPRIPVRGIQEVIFIIQRNGVGDERLPTSMTCFGRLLLPEYSTKEIMAEKLKLAIENSTGFGTQ